MSSATINPMRPAIMIDGLICSYPYVRSHARITSVVQMSGDVSKEGGRSGCRSAFVLTYDRVMVHDRTMPSAYDLSLRDKSSPAPLVLTAPEVAAVVSQLEGEPCSVRRVRYLLSELLATDAAPQRGQARLSGPVDVALMRLAVRLEAQGLSAWVARVVLAYGWP